MFQSAIVENEELVNLLNIHIQSKGKWFTACDVVKFSNQADVKEWFGLKGCSGANSGYGWMVVVMVGFDGLAVL